MIHLKVQRFKLGEVKPGGNSLHSNGIRFPAGRASGAEVFDAAFQS